jgi:hypothetical protein
MEGVTRHCVTMGEIMWNGKNAGASRRLQSSYEFDVCLHRGFFRRPL